MTRLFKLDILDLSRQLSSDDVQALAHASAQLLCGCEYVCQRMIAVCFYLRLHLRKGLFVQALCHWLFTGCLR